jgi:hypothetical protein
MIIRREPMEATKNENDLKGTIRVLKLLVVGNNLIRLWMVYIGAVSLFGVYFRDVEWTNSIVGAQLRPVSIFSSAGIMLAVALLCFRKTRAYSGACFMFIAQIWSLSIWFVSLLIVAELWGKVWLTVALFFFAIGVVPAGILALLFSRQWPSLLINLFSIALVGGFFYLGNRLIAPAINASPSELFDEAPVGSC